MPARFNADAAKGINAIIQFNLKGEDEKGGQYQAIIRDGTLEVMEGTHPEPNVTVTMAGTDYVDMMTGRLSGLMVFLRVQPGHMADRTP